MAHAEINGIEIYYELQGEGEPLALVHGSWVNASAWQGVAPGLAESFQVLIYDRRGHSRSERPVRQGSVHEDADDLGALLEALDLAPAHVVTDSFGGSIALRLAAKRPELLRSLSCHEPPLFDLLADDPASQEHLRQGARSFEAVAKRIAAGDHEAAARQFVEEVAFGPGAWENELPGEIRAIFTENAPTFLDELGDPHQLGADLEALARLETPVRLTQGSESPPVFPRVIDRLVEVMPSAKRATIEGAAHVPQLTVPQRYTEMIAGFAREKDASRAL